MSHDDVKHLLWREKYPHWIDDDVHLPASDQYVSVINPATENSICAVANGSESDIQRAVETAQAASESWQDVIPRERGQTLHAIADRIRENIDRLASIHCAENGKPLSQARDEVETCADYFTYYAGITDKLHGDSIPLGPEYVNYTFREPLGVTGHILPWNFPVGIFGRSIAPSLACGNAAVVKPAEQTPITTLEIARLLSETDLPDGCLNVVAGDGNTGAALTELDEIDGLAFTGSVKTGKKVASAAGQNLIPVHVEAGGKNPNVVYPDANIGQAIENTVTSIFGLNAGQVCSAGDRLILHEDIEEHFLDRLSDAVAELTIGPGRKDVDVGPLVSEEQYDKVIEYIDIGYQEVGEPFIVGGEVPSSGYFVEPTVFTDVPVSSRIAQEEIFGPVLTVTTFSTETEAIEIANSTSYGLVAGIFTEDIRRANRFARDVEAGQVFINEWFAGGIETPFGGYNESGFGREKGLKALDNYSQVKNICSKM